MELYEALMTRRSIRKYLPNPVAYHILEKLIRAAMQAPSAHNAQAWQFVIINQRSLLDEIATFHPYGRMMRQAQAAIAVCGDKNLEPNVEYLAINCAAATQNILLAAHDAGLGAVWLGVYPRVERIEKLEHMLNLPEQIIPIALVGMGYPAETKEKQDRYRADRVHINKW